MRIFVDADSCPVKEQIERVGMKYRVRVLFYANRASKIHRPTYARLIWVKSQPQAADNAIAGRCSRGDVVVTYDVRLARRCMAKGAYVLNGDGWMYTNDLIHERLYKSRKRKTGTNEIFERVLEALMERLVGWLRF